MIPMSKHLENIGDSLEEKKKRTGDKYMSPTDNAP